eukprot:c39750_g1_i1 orf=14-196(-)
MNIYIDGERSLWFMPTFFSLHFMSSSTKPLSSFPIFPNKQFLLQVADDSLSVLVCLGLSA